METATLTRNINLAVLPLSVLSDDPRMELFCQGLVMDLIAGLSRFRSFQVMAYDAIKEMQEVEAPGASFLEAFRPDYLVKGLVRHQGGRMVFTLQLANVRQNRLVWAEKFSGRPDELFHIQEEIEEKVVMSLQHFVDHDLLSQMRRKPLTSLSAYECWLKGYQELKKGTLEADEQARACFQQALELDPHYARACTGMSLSYFNEWSCQLWSRWEVSRNGAFEWARRALDLDEWDHVSNAILGRIHLFQGAYEKAEHYLRRSLHINANDAETLLLIASSFAFLGRLEEAVELYERARRLNPADNLSAIACGMLIHFERGAINEAVSLAERYEIGKGWVDFPAFLAAAYFYQGEYGKMQECWNRFLQDFSQKINGGLPADNRTALEWMINVNPYRGETRLQAFWEHIGQQGAAALLPEKPEAQLKLQNHFTLEGEWWSVSYGGRAARLPDLKGCHDLARLLARPRSPIHCTELMGAAVAERGEAVFDQKARAAYRRRILELQEELREAEAAHHSRRLAALQEEYDRLIEHLAQAMGKGGKARKKGSTAEKARTAVTWRIRSAIKKISEVHPALGRHLEVSVNTGLFCEYAPEREVEWVAAG